MTKILWKDEPDEKDYSAAWNYLRLLGLSSKLITELRQTKGCELFMARDIIRASILPILGIDNNQIEKNLKKIKDGEKLSPILLVADVPLIIADGYHRVCAVYRVDDTEEIPCKLVYRSRI